MNASIIINFATSVLTFVFGVLLLTGIIYPDNKDSSKLMFGIVLIIYGVYRFINVLSKLKQQKLDDRMNKINDEREKLLRGVMKNNIMYIFVFSMMIFFSGCKFDEIKSVTTTGELTIVVDENVEPLMKAEIAEFERLNPEAKVKIKVAPTKVAKADLINGDTKFIVVTRNFDDEEKAVLEKNKTEVKEYPIAVDGIGFIVNPKNPVKKVTSDDLKNIFTQ
ncbi:MAG: substrate-binding domain-containing protein [Ignavibacteria bacterium]|nr:substrate-binding domain-containing protein [Ignavibacteria bacterium]